MVKNKTALVKTIHYIFSLIAVTNCLVLTSCMPNQQEKEPTVYEIPSSIRGGVMIIYGYKNGEPAKIKANKRLLQVPSDGTLYTQSEPTYGLANDQYYLVADSGIKKEIKIEINTKSSTSLCIYNINTGKVLIDGIEYAYEAFMVCRKDSVSYYNDFQKKVRMN